MRMQRDTYHIEKEKHMELMNKLIEDGMSFNEFIDRIIFMYLEEKYTLETEAK